MLHDRIINKPEITKISDFNKSFYLSNGGCDFKFLKKFLRSYKNDYYFTEYVFIVDALKGHLKEGYSQNIFKLMNTDLKDEFTPYFYEYKLKDIVYNDIDDAELKLFNYLERYINICIKYHYDKLLEYQKKLNTERFGILGTEAERISTLKDYIEIIKNEQQFGSSRNILFYFFDIDSPNRSIFLIPLEFKKEFFENKIQLLQSKSKEKLEPEAIDLSDTSTTEKIIYLQKLGVIDFLRNKQPFLSSTNSLATVLSAVTGEKTGTIQPMLNPMINKEAGQKNNPFRSKITVSKVETQLINIGFNLNETI